MKPSTLFPLLLALGVSSLLAQSPDGADTAGTRFATSNEPPEGQVAARTSWFPRLLPRGSHLIPETSIEQPEDVGVRKHTNHVMFVPDAVTSGPQGETPQSIREVYNLPPTGGSGVIAIIDAFHYPTALNDFNVFSKEFALPAETSTNATLATNKVFQVVYARGVQPAINRGWAQEAALDIEWAHAMAPNAKIVLVEAASDSNADLDAAVRTANQLPGVAEVSMSYGGTETRNEASGDGVYSKPFVVYIAASGDVGGVVNYPGCSSKVIAAGGTRITRDTDGNFVSETGWAGTGGGASRFIPRPAYQNNISATVGAVRGVPDLSFDAAPASGVSVYDSTSYLGEQGWMIFGGTSVAAPSLAGIINTAATSRRIFAGSTAAELTTIYNQLNGTAYPTEFRDISQGKAGQNRATARWDFVTGVGSPLGLNGK
jgi:kumamolisin